MDSCAPSRSRRILEWLLIAAFAACLASSAVDMVVRPDVKQSTLLEFRNPAKFPEHPQDADAWMGYPPAFDAWWNDHFGLRDKLVRWHNLRDWYVFGISPTSKLVLGKDAWIFFADDKSIDVYRGAYPLSPNELEGWRRVLIARRDWLASRNIRYLFVFVPNKDQVYPEHLTDALQIRGTTRLDQLLASLKEHGDDVDVLDLRTALIAEKKRDRPGDYVYHRLGTHWTDRGGYAAYLAILERLKPHFPMLVPIPRDAFDVAPKGQGDSWAPHLYMADLLQQTALEWRLRAPRAKYETSTIETTNEFETTNPDTSLPRAFVLHDSFGPTLRPWLAENFSYVWWTWGWAFDTEIARIQNARPDVVIELFVDRILCQNYPQVTGAQGPGPRRKAFEASSDVLYRAEGAELRSRLRPYGKALFEEPSSDDTALALRCKTPLDGALIPQVAFPPDDDVIVRVEIESPAASGLDLFFQKDNERSFERRRVCSEKLYKGSNRVFFRLFAGRLAGPMFLHLRATGVYHVKSIEVRAVRDAE